MKKILISGGSDGLGKAPAQHLVKSGHSVAILAPNEDKLRAVAGEIGCSFRACDVSVWEQVKDSVRSLNDELGGIEVLINNAAVAHGGKLEDMTPEIIQRTFDVNVVGLLFFTKAVIPIMKAAGDGYIINVSSQGVFNIKPERTLYGGSKWAVTGITKVLQAELASSGIKVTGLYPGAMEQTMAKDGQRRPQSDSIPYQDMVDAVEFILSRSDGAAIPELGIKHLDN